jgi:hypothetical protein
MRGERATPLIVAEPGGLGAPLATFDERLGAAARVLLRGD